MYSTSELLIIIIVQSGGGEQVQEERGADGVEVGDPEERGGDSKDIEGGEAEREFPGFGGGGSLPAQQT